MPSRSRFIKVAVLAALVALFGLGLRPAQAAGTWTPVGDLNLVRNFGAALSLTDGRILVVAGLAGTNQQPTATAELYDSKTSTWSYAGNMATARGVERERQTEQAGRNLRPIRPGIMLELG